MVSDDGGGAQICRCGLGELTTGFRGIGETLRGAFWLEKVNYLYFLKETLRAGSV